MRFCFQRVAGWCEAITERVEQTLELCRRRGIAGILLCVSDSGLSPLPDESAENCIAGL